MRTRNTPSAHCGYRRGLAWCIDHGGVMLALSLAVSLAVVTGTVLTNVSRPTSMP